MSKFKNFYEKIAKAKGNVHRITCESIICENCILNSENNADETCCGDRPYLDNLKLVKEYLEKYNHEEELELAEEKDNMKNNEILFAKLREDVIIPSKREEDGAFDIYANIKDDYMVIKPHETVLIPTGLVSAFSSDYVAILKERGSTGTKGMGQRCGVIDSGFRGEWQVPITNHNDTNLIITKQPNLIMPLPVEGVVYPYSKAICQCIMVEVPKLSIKEVSIDEVKSISSERGEGMLGSSGK